MVILSTGRLKAFGVEDDKLVHGLLPILGRPSPISGDVAQGQPDQLGSDIVTGEMAAYLDDLAQPGVNALNGIGCVDNPADQRREGKEWNDPVPGSTPGGSHGGKFLAPRPLCDGIEFSHGRFGTRRGANRFDCRRKRLALFPTRVVEAVANQINDVGCSVLAGKTIAKASDMPFRPSVTESGCRPHATSLQIVEDLHTELVAPSVLSIRSPRMFIVPSGSTPSPR